MQCWSSTLMSSAVVVDRVGPYLPAAIYAFGLAGRLGLTMILVLTSDLIGLMSIQWYLCYLTLTYVFRQVLRIQSALFSLLQGRA